MTEHKCVTGEWRPGVVKDCLDCYGVSKHGPAYLKEGYKSSTRTIIRDMNGSYEKQYWSGRQDAHIKPKAIRVTGHSKEGI